MTTIVRAILPVVFAVALGAAACRTPATEMLVQIDTDVPADRSMTINVTVRRGGSTADARVLADAGLPRAPECTFRRSADAGMFDGGAASTRCPVAASLPASLGIVPRPGAPMNEEVELQVEAVVLATASLPAFVLRRRASFSFVQRASPMIRVFLTTLCYRRDVGCRSVSPAECVRQTLCEEAGQTCGNDGNCVSIPVQASDAGTHGDASDLVDIVDGGDIADRPETCARSCAPGQCGPDGCGGFCPSCAAGQVCNALARCETPGCTPNCAGRSCGPDPVCGSSCGDCPSGQTCDGAGRCVCPGFDCGHYGLCAPNSYNSASTAPHDDGCGATLSCGNCCGTGFFCGSGFLRTEYACGCGNPPSGSGWADQGGDCWHRFVDPPVSCCAPGLTNCSGSCFDTNSDMAHCGACSTACSTGQTCTAGVCVPPIVCPGVWVPGNVDPNGTGCDPAADGCYAVPYVSHSETGWSGSCGTLFWQFACDASGWWIVSC